MLLAIIDIKTENIKINFKQKNNNKNGGRSRQAEDWTKYKKNIVKPKKKIRVNMSKFSYELV